MIENNSFINVMDIINIIDVESYLWTKLSARLPFKMLRLAGMLLLTCAVHGKSLQLEAQAGCGSATYVHLYVPIGLVKNQFLPTFPPSVDY